MSVSDYKKRLIRFVRVSKIRKINLKSTLGEANNVKK